MSFLIDCNRILRPIQWEKIGGCLELHLGYRLNKCFAQEIIFARIQNFTDRSLTLLKQDD